jgi:hypothetical protein
VIRERAALHHRRETMMSIADSKLLVRAAAMLTLIRNARLRLEER